MADKRRYTFIEKGEARDGVFAVKLAVAAAALFVLDVFISFLYRGEAGGFVGGIALTAMLLSGYGLICGMRSFSEKDKSPAYPVAGTVLSGAVLAGLLILYLMGL